MKTITNTLSKLNLWAAILHGVSFLAVMIVFLTLRKGKINFPTSLWRLKVKDLSEDNQEFSSMSAKKEVQISTDFLKAAVLLTFALTCIAHIFYYTDGFGSGSYSHQLKSGKNDFRWLEYAITATIMIMVLSTISGVKSTKVYFLLALMNIVLQGIGNMSENASNTQTKIVGLVIGFLLLGGIWYGILDSFYRALDDAKDIPGRDGPPDWVRGVIIPMFVWWLSFGIVALLQTINYKKPGYDYRNYEKGYIILSYLSKAFMGYYLAFGLTRPAPRKKETEDTTTV